MAESILPESKPGISAGRSELRLLLEGDDSLPRELILTVSAFGDLCALLYPRPQRTLLTYVNLRLDQCRLDDGCLWIGHAAFDVTRAEASQIHARLAPVGLRSNYEAAP